MSVPPAAPSVPSIDRPFTASVVALGKIGLPLAVQIAAAGHTVVGVDIDQRVVDLVNAGEAPFPGEAGWLRRWPRSLAMAACGPPPTLPMRSPAPSS